MRGKGVRSAGVTLVLIVVVLASIAAVPVGGTLVCEDDDGYDLERTEGAWVVNGGQQVTVHADGEEWDRADVVDVSEVFPTSGFRVVTVESFARGPDGGWWAVGDEGFVVRFADDWTFTGEFYEFDGAPAAVHDIARVRGRWWVLYGDVGHGDTLLVFDDTWSRVAEYSIGGKHNGMTVAGGSLWTVGEDGTVTEFDVGSDGPSHVRTVRGAIGRELTAPQDLHRGPDGGWWVLSEGGGIAQYTTVWEHTGYQFGPAKDSPSCGASQSDGHLFLAAYAIVVGAGVVVTFRTRPSRRVRGARLGLGYCSSLLGYALYNYELPELFAWLYSLPDLAVSVPLVSAALLASTLPCLLRETHTVIDVFALAALASPLFFAGLLY